MRMITPIALASSFLGVYGTLNQPQPQCPSDNSNITKSCTDGNGIAHNYTVCVSPEPTDSDELKLWEFCVNNFFNTTFKVKQCPLETIDQLMDQGNFDIPGMNFETTHFSKQFTVFR